MTDTFPRQHARTQRLSLGEPRTFTISPDGSHVMFARSAAGSDPVNALWMLDVATGTETCVFQPQDIAHATGDITAEELRRRERARESAGGVVTYATNAAVTHAVTVLGGQLFHIDVLNKTFHAVAVAPGIFDARLSPDGTRVAYVRNGSLYVTDLENTSPVLTEQELVHEDNETISWGVADFIAAEEMGRQRGYWWSPDSTTIAACRVDVARVDTWHIADPANPSLPAVTHRYPGAGTTNATVSVHLINVATKAIQDVQLPSTYEYVNSLHWSSAGFIVQLQSRDQKMVEIFRVNASDGSVASLYRDEDTAWVELVGGVPALAHNSQLVTCADRDGVRSLLIDGVVVTPNSIQVRSVLSVGAVVNFAANDIETPWFLAIWQYDLATKQLRCITASDEVCSATANDNAVVVRSSSLRSPRASFRVIAQHGNSSHELRSFSEEMLVSPNVSLHTVGPNNIPVAILAPRDGAQTKLPVLFDPYGGPHAQRVVASQLAFATSQWFADQGFIVVVADGRGTPGKGSDYERAVLGDLAAPVLNDQVAVLDALFALEPRADVSRVAIRGWSFGGYLAALAVLRRPDKFHCAVAGAPVTDWRLYDTHYTERYLGNPATNDAPYEASSLMNETHGASRPLLLIHGLADDNVVAAHTLRLSSALLASGKDHEVLPLSGVTHMTPQEIVAENLLLHQLSFINRSLPSGQ